MMIFSVNATTISQKFNAEFTIPQYFLNIQRLYYLLNQLQRTWEGGFPALSRAF